MACMCDKARGWSNVRRCLSTSIVQGDTMMTPDDTTIQVRSYGLRRLLDSRSFWKDLNTGSHEKAPVRCPCRRLATLHGASRAH